MSQDVTQWLAEIKSLKQQLADAQQEREQAYASAANWQKLYETEAQQRRAEATLAKQTIADLEQQIQQLRGTSLEPVPADATPAVAAEIAPLQTPEALREKLIQVLAERDRLRQALKTEQTNHAQTRRGLTTALGDAIDQLSKQRGEGGRKDEG